VGRLFSFFSKKSNVRSLSPSNTIDTETISYDTTHTNNVVSGEGTTDMNYKNEALHCGMIVSSRQLSEGSALTTASRRVSWSSSTENAISPQQNGETSKLAITSQSKSSISSHSTKLVEGRGSPLSSTGSEDNTLSNDHGIPNIREVLCTIQDNSFHSTATEEPLRYSNCNEEEGKENMNNIQHDPETQLILRAASIEEDQLNPPPPPPYSTPPSDSPIKLNLSLKLRKFLTPPTPEVGAPKQSNLRPLAHTRVHSDNNSFRRKPMNKDLSLDDLRPAILLDSVLPSDLSIDLESLALEMQHEDIESRQSIESVLSYAPIEVNAELSQIHVSSSRSSIMGLDSLLPVMPDEDDELDQSIREILCDIPHNIDNEPHQHEDNEPHQYIENVLSDAPIEVNAELSQMHVSSSESSIMDLDSPLQVMPNEDDEIDQSIEDILCDISHNTDDEARQHKDIEPRQSIENEAHDVHIELNNELRQIRVNSLSPAALSMNLDYTLLLDGSEFDSNCDSNSTVSETHSSEQGSVTKDMPYQNPDNTVMEDRSHTSSDSSQNSVYLQLNLQNDLMEMKIEGGSNRDMGVAVTSPTVNISHLEEALEEEEELPLLHPISTIEEEANLPIGVATASSGMTHLEELYSGICSKYKEKNIKAFHPTSSDGKESDISGTLSKLPLSRDSSQSSIMSFDSTEFMEDEQVHYGKSIECCSISTHDITTIHEEKEDDIAIEAHLSLNVDEGLTMDQDQNIMRMKLTSQGTAGTGTISAVTDDCYTGGLSSDSVSSGSEEGNHSQGIYRKILGWKDGMNINMSKYDSFDKPSYQQPELTVESPPVSISDSACSESVCSYDSNSSKSVKHMFGRFEEEAKLRKLRRSKMKDRIAKMRELNEKVSYATEYVSSLVKGKMRDEDITLRIIGIA